MNMVNYMRANRTEMTETDAHFVRDEFRGDLVALRSEERELLSAFLGRYSFGFFGSKVFVMNKNYDVSFYELQVY